MSKHKSRKLQPLSQKKDTISVLLPCHNEALGIRQSIRSCLRQTHKFDQIIVIDDASTDKTVKIIEKHFKNELKKKQIILIKLSQNKGNKSYVQQHGMQVVHTDLFVCVDGDTILDKDFVLHVLPHFQNHAVAAVAGHVQSLKDNWLTACREIEYTIAQVIHKRAQSLTNTVAVIPGCCAVFRTQIFKDTITFDHDTLTEDLDFTYKLHCKSYTILYEPKSVVYTQDPADIRSYIRQMRRWYAGNWQNFKKHAPTLKKRKLLGLEIVITYSETIFLAMVLFTIPFISRDSASILYASLFLFAFIAACICCIRTKRKDVLFYFPALVLLLHLNSFIFLREGCKCYFLNQKDLVWHRAIRKEIE